MNGVGSPQSYVTAVGQLDALGEVLLRGRRSDAIAAWLRRQRVVRTTAFGLCVVGVAATVGGYLLWRQAGLWALFIPLGLLLLFVSAVAAGVITLSRMLTAGRVRAELAPVHLAAQGVTLRGVGPLPWSFLGAPEIRRIRTKNDIQGDCAVMPLTPAGHAYVNAQADWWRTLVGPKPYLRADIPWLLLPGIDGFTEEQTLAIFAAARAKFLR